MTDLSELYHTIDQLSRDQLDDVTRYIQQRRGDVDKLLSHSHLEGRLVLLKQGFAELREGLSEKDLEELARAMNVEAVNPDELAEYDWIDDLPEMNE